jgi:hypothetical protein
MNVNMASIQDDCLSLHDCLSLGQVELGLGSNSNSTAPCADELHRLPTLLRLLAAARPYAQQQQLLDNDDDDNDDDDWISRTVRRLEEVGATYSAAEQVEVVACHLAPALCRTMSRRMSSDNNSHHSATTITKPTKLSVLKQSDTTVSIAKRQKGNDGRSRLQPRYNDLSDEDDDQSLSEEIEQQHQDLTVFNDPTKKRDRFVVAAATEDSLDATVSRILSELSSAASQSLQPLGTTTTTVDWSLAALTNDSLLAEPASSTMAAVMVGGGSDLGATVVSLMHHATALRHVDVAVRAVFFCSCACVCGIYVWIR